MLEFAIKFLGPVFAVLIFFALVSIAQKRDSSEGDVLVIEYGRIFKVLVFLFLLFSLVMPALMHLQELNNVQDYNVFQYASAAGFFLILSIYLFIEFYYVKYVVDGKTIKCLSPWRKDRLVNIDEIIDVSFSHVFKYYKLKTKGKGVIRVYMFMERLPRFLDILERELNVSIERYS